MACAKLFLVFAVAVTILTVKYHFVNKGLQSVKPKMPLEACFPSVFSHTHIVAVQIQNTDAGELINKVWDLADQVPAQVQFIHLTQLLDALWHHGDLLEAEVQTTFTIQSQLHTVLGHFQGDCLTFSLPGFLPLGHSAAGRHRTVTGL